MSNMSTDIYIYIYTYIYIKKRKTCQHKSENVKHMYKYIPLMDISHAMAYNYHSEDVCSLYIVYMYILKHQYPIE